MSTQTENLGLTLPEDDEYFELDTWTGNCRKLDVGYGTTLQTIANDVAAAMHQYAEEGGTIHDIDTGFITTLKEIHNGLGFKTWLGTTAEFEYLKANDLLEPNVLYLRSDDKTLNFPGIMDPTKTLPEVIAMADSFMIYKLTTTPNTDIYPVEVTQATGSSNGATVVYFAAGNAGFFMFTYGDDIYFNRFYASQAQGGYTFTGWIRLNPSDSGWQTLTISGTGFTAGSPTPQYRKIGNRVIVKGQIAVDMDNVSDVTTVFATLPSGYRPATALYRLIPGEGDRQARLYVSSSGGVNINYFKTYAGDTVTGSHWVQLDCEFLTD